MLQEQEQPGSNDQSSALAKNKPNKDNSGIWKVLNSNFVIFLFSTILVGGVSFVYKQWKENQSKEELDYRQEIIDQRIRNKLRAELTSRLDVIQKLQTGAKEFENKNIYLACWGNTIRNQPELNLKYYNRAGLFATYREWNLFEILTELERYEEESVKGLINVLKTSFQENNYRIRGYHQKTRTNRGEFLPLGRLNLQEKRYVVNGTGEIIILTAEDLPLVRYYYAKEELSSFMNSIEELQLALADAKTP